jgi:hypothetical protein
LNVVADCGYSTKGWRYTSVFAAGSRIVPVIVNEAMNGINETHVRVLALAVDVGSDRTSQ